MTSQNLRGKTAVVTGASSGIGRAAAQMLAAEGVKVALVARRKDRIEALAEDIGASAIAIAGDVSDSAQVAAIFRQIKNEFDGLDLLFNNAGVGIYGPFLEATHNDWKAQLDANIYGVLNCTQAALPMMLGRPGAMVASVSSLASHYGTADWSIYSATKFAVAGLHDSWRKEFGMQGVRFSLIAPGSVWTDWGNNLPEGVMEKRREALDALTAEDVASALLYAFAQPPRVLIEEITLRPLKQIAP